MLDHFEHALTTLSEECAEVIIECAKIKRFGTDSFDPADPQRIDNLTRLYKELHDVMGAIENLNNLPGSVFSFVPDTITALNKMDKIHKYRKVSERLGRVEKEHE
ncbi:hypothetical protein YOLOSWAG_60 [Erwinia phage vB_EamM_Yoloswag]|uniref:Uncharacterized protein n=1 Tax=Erwinia phage vB_EamM_Yoloswag TaxID=1958956 RepID=A0A1S6L2Z7_9CAUD|nr:nucleoside triphosphate pyrophosphohydrolase [Erwinia phage vB_EamM_Yoloswag]AQT28543.1 hypothetical protein YOLOSWAG_60 [Erwinia phage vB_EamM_Yoloswag]